MTLALGPGELADTITYLEMMARPPRPSLPSPAAKLALMRVERCTLSFYRYLYVTVGSPWLWFERRQWRDERLRNHLARPTVEISVLYAGGVPAGYYEIERAKTGDVELCYFGLAPDFIGHGFGAYFLQAALDSAWQPGTRRVWVHTCTYDHPRALGMYQRAGFQVYRRRDVIFDDPRLTGALPRDIQHPLLPRLRD
jgi:GNAT superfamily N-acetyltransferase